MSVWYVHLDSLHTDGGFGFSDFLIGGWRFGQILTLHALLTSRRPQYTTEQWRLTNREMRTQDR
jgi:hypothetical protein